MTKITRLTNSKLSQQKQGAAPKFWHNTVMINLLMAGVLGLFGVGYLGIVNATAADTFAVAELSSRIDETKNQNQRLELNITEVLALPHVDAVSQQYNLVAASNVHYLDDSAAVALAQ